MFELQLLNSKSASDLVGVRADENLVDLMQAAGVSVPLCVRNLNVCKFLISVIKIKIFDISWYVH